MKDSKYKRMFSEEDKTLPMPPRKRQQKRRGRIYPIVTFVIVAILLVIFWQVLFATSVDIAGEIKILIMGLAGAVGGAVVNLVRVLTHE